MIDSLKKTLHERMTSPFTGSFLVSWAIVNWRVVLTVFSSETYNQKVILIQELFTPFWWDGALNFIVYPLLGACFYISIYQLIIAGSTRVWFLVDRAKAWGEKSKLLTVKESQKFIIENSELKAENEQLKVSSVEVVEENKRYKQDIYVFEKSSGIQITDTLAAQGIMETRKALTQTETECKNLENASASDRAMLDKKNKELDKALKENEQLIAYEKILSDEITSLKEENTVLKKLASNEDMKELGLSKNSKNKIKIQFDLSKDEKALIEKMRKENVSPVKEALQKVIDALREDKKAIEEKQTPKDIRGDVAVGNKRNGFDKYR